MGGDITLLAILDGCIIVLHFLARLWIICSCGEVFCSKRGSHYAKERAENSVPLLESNNDGIAYGIAKQQRLYPPLQSS